MKYNRVNLRILLASVSAIATVAMVGGLGVFHASADSWDKKTVLTINEKVQVRDRVLEPGTYVFKLLNSNSDRHIVQIFNEDQSNIVDTVLAIPNYRLQPTDKSRFGFWETPPGYNKALRSWFYPGDNFGQEFPYPKHLEAIETASLVTTTRVPEPAPQAVPAPAPEPAPVEEPKAAEPVNPPQEIASAAPPPEPTPEPQAAPAPEPAPQTPAPAAPAETLPKTASVYPLIGLLGLGCIGLFGLVRDKGAKRRS